MIQIIKAIIFDIDDTILNFSRKTVYCYLETAKDLKLKPVAKEKIFKFYGTPLKNMVKKFWPKADPKKFEDRATEKIRKLKIKPIKGAKQVIKNLSKNYKLGLLTSKAKVLMNLNLKQNKISKRLFVFSYSKDDVKYHKPDPRVFSKPLKKLKLKPKEILYIGDSIYDCIATKRAKINFIAVLTGHYTKKEFQKYKVDNNNVLKSINSLPKWLKQNG